MAKGSSKSYDGQVAVVTGASSGIGRRVATDLARRGATVVGIARRAELLAELQTELRALSPESWTYVCDVADGSSFEGALRSVEERHGVIDILINNAGINELLRAVDNEHAGEEETAGTVLVRRLFDVNFFSVVTGTLAVVPRMVERRRGIIVNVSSDSARAPERGQAGYAASKAAVSAFSEAIAHEVSSKGVHVHVLYPAWVPTAMGLSGNEDGGRMPPKPVRRTEEQVSTLLLERMGGKRMEINAAALPLMAPIARTLVPSLYQRAMGRMGTTP